MGHKNYTTNHSCYANRIIKIELLNLTYNYFETANLFGSRFLVLEPCYECHIAKNSIISFNVFKREKKELRIRLTMQQLVSLGEN